MDLVHQIIPLQYVESFLEHGLHFTRCSEFVDQLEFRFGYCHYKTGLGWPSISMEQCVHTTFLDDSVNDLIKGTAVSCWIKDHKESYSMWEIYGRRDASIRVSIDRKKLTAAVEKTGLLGMSGSVTYNFKNSETRPEFLEPINSFLNKNDYFHLFFHKHSFYSFETEYRITLATDAALSVPIDPTFVHRITLSPLGKFNEEMLARLIRQFGSRVTQSSLSNPY